MRAAAKAKTQWETTEDHLTDREEVCRGKTAERKKKKETEVVAVKITQPT